MADILRRVVGIFDKRYRDMGDGTHAEVIAIGDLDQPLTEAELAGLVVDVLLQANAGVNIGNVGLLAGDELVGEVGIDQTTPGTTNLVYAQPFDGLLEGGLTELIGINEEVNTNDYGGSVGVALPGTYSGEITQFIFHTTEDGSGAILIPSGILYIFDVDPTIAVGDPAMSAAERLTMIGQVWVGSGDWKADANGASAVIKDQPIDFHSLATLYFAWLHTDATDFNDGAGDDERLRFNIHYRRES